MFAAISALTRPGALALACLTLAGTPAAALAGRDRGDHRRGGYDRCDDRGWRSSRDCGTGFSFSISSGSTYFGGSRYDDCRPLYRPYRPYCPPVTYCPPPVVIAPCPPPRPVYVAPCPPPVVYRETVYTSPVVVRSEPVYVDRPVVVERPVVVSAPPPPVVLAPVSSAQDRDLGTTYLRLGDLDNAARLYQRYLASYSSDAGAQRGLGLVELGRGNALEGVRWIASAYRLDRSLALSPPSPEGVGGTAVYQRMLDSAVLHAGQARTADAWLSVAILQHGLGQRDPAQREAALQSLQRAREAGLETPLLDAMTGAVAR